MPLTKTGIKTIGIFEKIYGKKKGENIFYAYLNSRPKKKRRLFER